MSAVNQLSMADRSLAVQKKGHEQQAQLPWRQLPRRLRLVFGLVWAAWPAGLAAMLIVTLIEGVTPTAYALIIRGVLNALVPSGGAAQPGPGRAHHVSVTAPLSERFSHLPPLIVLLGLVSFGAALMPQLFAYLSAQQARRFELAMQDRTYRAVNSFPGISRLENPTFHDKIRVVQTLTTSAPNSLVPGICAVGQSLITAATMLIALQVVSPLLTFFVAGFSLPAIFAQFALRKRRADVEWQNLPDNRRQIFYSDLLTERKAAKEIRVFGLGDFLQDRMRRHMHSVHAQRQAMSKLTLRTESALMLLTVVVTTLGTFWVVRRASSGTISIGDVSLFIGGVASVQGSISGVVTRLADIFEILTLFGHYEDIVAAGPDLALAESPRPAPALRSGIHIRDVWFRYDANHRWILRGLSMHIPAGSAAALIGLNGSGKSTLVKLLCRLYDPDRGIITWDGIDIREMSPEQLRDRIGAVFQDYMTYDLTAAENVGLGDLSRLDDRASLRQAAALAGIDGTLASLPAGFDTMLSRIYITGKQRNDPGAGVLLSGGQWQRVAVARGFMRSDRDLLILDEPSAGLDAEAEHAIHRQLASMRWGRTSLLISHRLASVRDADVIFVLADGRIAEAGTHDELMAAGDRYQTMFALQASGYQGSDAPVGSAAMRASSRPPAC
jgi:ATP-binding cassette subfamily B protein